MCSFVAADSVATKPFCRAKYQYLKGNSSIASKNNRTRLWIPQIYQSELRTQVTQSLNYVLHKTRPVLTGQQLHIRVVVCFQSAYVHYKIANVNLTGLSYQFYFVYFVLLMQIAGYLESLTSRFNIPSIQLLVCFQYSRVAGTVHE